MRDDQGFSHINEIYWLFLDQAHYSNIHSFNQLMQQSNFITEPD